MEPKIWLMVFNLVFGSGTVEDPTRAEVYVEEKPFIGTFEACEEEIAEEEEVFRQRNADLTYINSFCKTWTPTI